ncbi:Os05g0270900 [Oryza sativa Japonica Group]|jgi:hypothetical protein|uniref:Os05g0270900 protein n=1 Tax=Oryza sativa subsp. japonica TaxID=39947 RepID=A0A0P0WK01_ORYSJ|nr:Os05g0270900 [Oryza sativa Japonica Group]
MEKVPATKREAKLCVVLAALLLLLGAPGVATADAVATSGSGRGGCTRSSGNISIEYPFGMEPGCYYVVGFNLTCDTRTTHPGCSSVGARYLHPQWNSAHQQHQNEAPRE